MAARGGSAPLPLLAILLPACSHKGPARHRDPGQQLGPGGLGGGPEGRGQEATGRTPASTSSGSWTASPRASTDPRPAWPSPTATSAKAGTATTSSPSPPTATSSPSIRPTRRATTRSTRSASASSSRGTAPTATRRTRRSRSRSSSACSRPTRPPATASRRGRASATAGRAWRASEYLAGYFYQRTRKAYRAAIARYEIVLSDYPDYERLDEVLLRLARSAWSSRPGRPRPCRSSTGCWPSTPQSGFADEAPAARWSSSHRSPGTPSSRHLRHRQPRRPAAPQPRPRLRRPATELKFHFIKGEKALDGRTFPC